MHHPKLTWALCRAVSLLVRLSSAGSLPDHPSVVVCNHRSWLDPLLLIATHGRRRSLVFLAAREHVERRLILRRLLPWLGVVILVDRASTQQRSVLRQASAVLEAGHHLALFPEGRINVPRETRMALLPLEPGAAFITRLSKVPLVPVALAGTDDLHLRRHVQLVVGDPIAPEQLTDPELLPARLKTLIPPTPAPRRFRIATWLGRLQ